MLLFVWTINHQVAMTRVWVEAIIGGPWGACSGFKQRPTLLSSSGGNPLTRTRVAPTNHWTRRQGCGTAATLNTQPATNDVSAIVATGIPLTSTRALDDIVDI